MRNHKYPFLNLWPVIYYGTQDRGGGEVHIIIAVTLNTETNLYAKTNKKELRMSMEGVAGIQTAILGEGRGQSCTLWNHVFHPGKLVNFFIKFVLWWGRGPIPTDARRKTDEGSLFHDSLSLFSFSDIFLVRSSGLKIANALRQYILRTHNSHSFRTPRLHCRNWRGQTDSAQPQSYLHIYTNTIIYCTYIQGTALA